MADDLFDTITKPLDFASNMIQGSDVLLNWVTPESGIKYSGDLVFNIPGPTIDGGVEGVILGPRKLLTIKPKKSLAGESSLEFSLSFNFSPDNKTLWAQVFLSNFKGFDSAVLRDKIEISFQGVDLEEGYILSFAGELLSAPPEELLGNIFKITSELDFTEKLTIAVANGYTSGIAGNLLLLKKIILELAKIRTVFHRFSGAVLIDRQANMTPMGFKSTHSGDSNPAVEIPWIKTKGYNYDLNK